MPGIKRKAADDLSVTGRGERILVVDARVGGLDHHLACAEVVQRHLHHPAADRAVLIENTKRRKPIAHEADAVKVALHRVLLVRGERAVGDDKMLAAAEHLRGCRVKRVRVARVRTPPAKRRAERAAGCGCQAPIRAHQDHNHWCSIFQNAIPIFTSRSDGRTSGTVQERPPSRIRVKPNPVPTITFPLRPSSQL